MKHNLRITHDRDKLKSDDMYTLFKKFSEMGARALMGLSLTNKEPHDNDIYRVDVEPPTRIEVICFGIDKLDDTVEGVYDNINDLPNWMQERLSVLSMLPPNTAGMNDVKGIGRRITESIYWIYAQK
jgi:hypothetical protein